MSVNIRTTRRYMLEDGKFHNYLCENYIFFGLFAHYLCIHCIISSSEYVFPPVCVFITISEKTTHSSSYLLIICAFIELSVAQNMHFLLCVFRCQMVEWLATYKLERIWKETFMSLLLK